MLLYTPLCIIKKFRGGMTALFCSSPRGCNAILNCIRNGKCGARSLVRRIGNLFARLVKH